MYPVSDHPGFPLRLGCTQGDWWPLLNHIAKEERLGCSQALIEVKTFAAVPVQVIARRLRGDITVCPVYSSSAISTGLKVEFGTCYLGPSTDMAPKCKVVPVFLGPSWVCCHTSWHSSDDFAAAVTTSKLEDRNICEAVRILRDQRHLESRTSDPLPLAAPVSLLRRMCK